MLAVTTALCADHAAQAAPATRTQAIEFGQIASRLVIRLAQNFRRTLPAAISEPAREQRSIDTAFTAFVISDIACSTHAPVSPFQFRLPPPIV